MRRCAFDGGGDEGRELPAVWQHLRNVYPIDVPLSRAFLAGVYPIDMHLIGVHLMGVHLMGISILGAGICRCDFMGVQLLGRNCSPAEMAVELAALILRTQKIRRPWLMKRLCGDRNHCLFSPILG
jgi:hypothetical protein